MRQIQFAAIAGLLGFAFTGCSEKPPIESRLPAEALAWQPYRVGQVLRFGQAKTNKVRTFAITEVHDEFIEYSRGGNAPVYLGPAAKYRVQTIAVTVSRTDTVRYMRTAVSTAIKPDSMLFTTGTALLNLMAADELTSIMSASLKWDIGFDSNFPLQAVLSGQAPADTAQQLLPTLRLGGVDYGPVLRLSNAATTSAGSYNPFPRNKAARRVYYAKGVGMVGFLEGATLWYRLP